VELYTFRTSVATQNSTASIFSHITNWHSFHVGIADRKLWSIEIREIPHQIMLLLNSTIIGHFFLQQPISIFNSGVGFSGWQMKWAYNELDWRHLKLCILKDMELISRKQVVDRLSDIQLLKISAPCSYWDGNPPSSLMLPFFSAIPFWLWAQMAVDECMKLCHKLHLDAVSGRNESNISAHPTMQAATLWNRVTKAENT
jgi:hypothetical protein